VNSTSAFLSQVERTHQNSPDGVFGERVRSTLDAVRAVAFIVEHASDLVVSGPFGGVLEGQQEALVVDGMGNQNAVAALVNLPKVGADLFCPGRGAASRTWSRSFLGRFSIRTSYSS
jgi:hypothetical protein